MWRGNWLRIAISVALGAVILWRVPMATLGSAFRTVRPGWILAALACVALMVLARWCRWHRLLAAGGQVLSAHDSARSLLGGFTLGAIAPGRLGELGRCLFLGEPSRAPALLLNVLDRALDMWALASFMVVSLMAVTPRPYGVFALGVWLALLPVAMGLPAFVPSLAGLRWWGTDFRTKLVAAAQFLRGIRIAPFAAWAFLSTALDLMTFFCLLRAFTDVDPHAALVTFPWIVTVGGLPLSVGGLGLREGAAAMLLARYAIPSAVAVDAALLLHVFSGLLPAAAGALWLACSRAQIGLSQAGRTATLLQVASSKE
jgi:uncharacterized membrane protein YbhN (UPF0104 family)